MFFADCRDHPSYRSSVRALIFGGTALIFLALSCNQKSSEPTPDLGPNEKSSAASERPSKKLAGVDSCGLEAAFGQNQSSGLNIVGGRAAKVSDLVSRSTVKIMPLACTGTLIGPQHIVTAAHCFADGPAVETIQLGFGSKGKVYENIRVTSYLVHPKADIVSNYTKIDPSLGTPLNDIAILTFEGPLPARIKPVLIAAAEGDYSEGSAVYLAGFGAKSSTDRSNQALQLAESKLGKVYPAIREIQLEAGKGIGGCNGDSGGPIYALSSDKACLKLISTVIGPGRGVDSTCEFGSATTMQTSLFRGWLRCSFAQLGQGLDYLVEDTSQSQLDCSLNKPKFISTP